MFCTKYTWRLDQQSVRCQAQHETLRWLSVTGHHRVWRSGHESIRIQYIEKVTKHSSEEFHTHRHTHKWDVIHHTRSRLSKRHLILTFQTRAASLANIILRLHALASNPVAIFVSKHTLAGQPYLKWSVHMCAIQPCEKSCVGLDTSGRTQQITTKNKCWNAKRKNGRR